MPLYYAGQRVKEDGTTADEATSFTAIVEKLGGYLLLTCELYDHDKKSEELEEAVESRCPCTSPENSSEGGGRDISR